MKNKNHHKFNFNHSPFSITFKKVKSVVVKTHFTSLVKTEVVKVVDSQDERCQNLVKIKNCQDFKNKNCQKYKKLKKAV